MIPVNQKYQFIAGGGTQKEMIECMWWMLSQMNLTCSDVAIPEKFIKYFKLIQKPAEVNLAVN